MAGKTVAEAVSAFGASAKAKLSNVAVAGAPEDQLRGPLETLVRDLAEIGGLPPGAVQLVGETTLAHLKTRPDYAVSVHNALVGFIEVKAPGKGADPRRFDNPSFQVDLGGEFAVPPQAEGVAVGVDQVGQGFQLGPLVPVSKHPGPSWKRRRACRRCSPIS